MPLLDKAIAKHRAGRHREALPLYEQHVAARPDDVNAAYFMGICLLEVGDLAEGGAQMRRVLAARPGHAGANHALGRIFAQEGQLDAAERHLREAVAADPGLAAAWGELAMLARRRGRLGAAISYGETAVKAAPTHAGLRLNLGNLYREAGRAEAAAEAWRRALKLAPQLVDAKLNLATALRSAGRTTEARAAFEKITVAHPRAAAAWQELGTMLCTARRYGPGVAALRRAIELEPGHRKAMMRLARACQATCDWHGLAALQPAIDAEVARARRGEGCAIGPFTALSLPISAADRMHIAMATAAATRAKITGLLPQLGFTFSRHPRDRIHIGYLSADYRDHATAHLMQSVFERHDRSRFAVTAYSIGHDNSSYRHRIEQGVDRFVDLTAIDAASAAKRIYDDKVDILVDLKTYTLGARPEIVALRPAPLVIGYMGFVGTSGGLHDYFAVDHVVVPEGEVPCYTEQLIHLPNSYYVNDDTQEIAPETPSRAAMGLPDGAFVFCCFCRHYKIEEEIFDHWMAILRDVPGSVLWLSEDSTEGAENLRRAAARSGIDAARLVFAPPMPKAEHLARHRCADLCLDTGRYGAHTTACDAMWAGVPFITRTGDSFPSRVGTSLLLAANMREMAVADWPSFVQLARTLATTPGKLSAVRGHLERNRRTCALFDTSRWARNFEKGLKEAWRIWAAGEAPRRLFIEDQG